MRRTPVNDYLEDISPELPEEIYGHLSDAIYETVCEFDEEVAQLKAENNKMRDLVKKLYGGYMVSCNGCEHAYEDHDGSYTSLDPDYCVFSFSDRYVGCLKRKWLEAEMRELGVTDA